MNTHHLIQKAILSEKAYKQMEKGIYTFMVVQTADKDRIAAAIKNIFGVEVNKVNVLKSFAKQKRVGKTRKTVAVGGGKKAIVYLKTGQKIDVLSPKVEKAKDSKKKKDVKVAKEVTNIKEVEGKEG